MCKSANAEHIKPTLSAKHQHCGTGAVNMLAFTPIYSSEQPMNVFSGRDTFKKGQIVMFFAGYVQSV